VAALVAAPLIIRRLGYRLLRVSERARVRQATGLAVGPAHRAEGRFDGGLSGLWQHRRSWGDPTASRPRSHRRDTASPGFWWRWGQRVTKRPGTWLAVGTAVLAVPWVAAFGIADRVDLPSAAAMPADSHVRQATEIGAEAFGPGVLSPLEIVVRATPETAEQQARQVARVLDGDPAVSSVQVSELADGGHYRVTAATVSSPASEQTEELVKSLREGPLHESLSGIRYDVGGESAMRVDANHALFEYLPLMLAVLLVLVLALFAVAMRSVVLPIKGVLMVVLSLGATAGGLLLLSTTEVGARLIGWSEPQNLHPIVPVTIVAIVVALSTDYEVILISRIAEVYHAGADNTEAIIAGVGRTGRVISSAAAIMIAVFFGFALSDVTPLRQLGVGLAFAVLIDATVVRGVLVPASMQLMGRWNWWFPSTRSLLRRRGRQREVDARATWAIPATAVANPPDAEQLR
jgi:RND superfamily putative drug exporter